MKSAVENYQFENCGRNIYQQIVPIHGFLLCICGIFDPVLGLYGNLD